MRCCVVLFVVFCFVCTMEYMGFLLGARTDIGPWKSVMKLYSIMARDDDGQCFFRAGGKRRTGL
jgi:hypothetical protein